MSIDLSTMLIWAVGGCAVGFAIAPVWQQCIRARMAVRFWRDRGLAYTWRRAWRRAGEIARTTNYARLP